MEPPTASASPSRATCLAIAIVLTIAGRAVPAWDYLFSITAEWCGGELTETQFSLCHDLSLLAIAALLCLSAPRQSGLCIGAIRQHWRGVLLVCGGPIVLAAIVYPNLPERPFAGAPFTMWTISPLAQDLLFPGFLYGWLVHAFPQRLGRLPWNVAMLLTAALFALWHVPNFGRGMSIGFVCFQLAYTGLGALVIGLARVWTGSIWYGLVTHCANNAIAAATS